MREEPTEEERSTQPADAAVGAGVDARVSDPGGPRAPTRGRRIAAVVLSALGVLVVVVIVAGFVVHLPYLVISPGSATPLDDSVVKIEGAPTYANEGDILFLTVRVSGSDPNLWKLLASWLDSDKEVVERTDVVGCLSDAENVAINTRLMEQSQDDAKKVALERLGYTVIALPAEVTVAEVRKGGDACAGAPAAGALRAGDQIVAIDDTAVAATKDIAALVQAHRPGDVVRFKIVRDGTTQSVDVVAGRRGSGGACFEARGAEARGGSGSPCVGIVVQTFQRYEYPIHVDIDIERVGGPSAGLAFALAIVDDLTPGNLTGGDRVAVTGAIASDATVLPVGGVEQKARTARAQGVDLMIVPRSEVAAARGEAGDVRVVGVDTLDDALAALQEAGGAPVPPPTTTLARS